MEKLSIRKVDDGKGIVASGGRMRLYNSNRVVLDRYETVITYGEFIGESISIKEFSKKGIIIN